MAKATVVKIEFNQKLKGMYDGCYFHTQTENGQKRKDFIFQKSDTFQVVKDLVAGDIVELKIEKKGDFYNLKDVVPSGEKSAATPTSVPSSPSKPSGGGSGWTASYAQTEDYIKHKDLMIIRQSTMKAAVDLVTAMLAKEMFKKTATADFLVEECYRIASKFEGQVTGKAAIAELASSVASLDTAGDPEYDEDCPFPK